MKKLTDYQYRIEDYSLKNLENLGFYYNKELSNLSKKYYSIKFPVIKYNEHGSLLGEITIDSVDGTVMYNVYDLKNRYYAPFYDNKYGDYKDILEVINNNIQKKMKKLGIKKIK